MINYAVTRYFYTGFEYLDPFAIGVSLQTLVPGSLGGFDKEVGVEG